jgi:hypothetical protein
MLVLSRTCLEVAGACSLVYKQINVFSFTWSVNDVCYRVHSLQILSVMKLRGSYVHVHTIFVENLYF